MPLTCAPHGGQPGRALGVEEVALVLSPAVSATPRPPAAGSRRLRRCATLLTRSVSSSRATPSQPCRRLRFIEIRGTLQVFGMGVPGATTHVLFLGLTRFQRFQHCRDAPNCRCYRRDGPWKGAAELRRKRTRGVSKWGGGGRNIIRLDAAALAGRRRVRGLASGGDG